MKKEIIKEFDEEEKRFMEGWNIEIAEGNLSSDYKKKQKAQDLMRAMEYIYFRHDAFKQFLLSKLEAQKQEIIKEIEKEVIDLLKEFSNTPLDKRGTGWDWLIKVKSILNLLEERSET